MHMGFHSGSNHAHGQAIGSVRHIKEASFVAHRNDAYELGEFHVVRVMGKAPRRDGVESVPRDLRHEVVL